MLDNRFSFADEQLFTELTPEEGAAISGGVDYTFKNGRNKPVTFTHYDFNNPGKAITLMPNKEVKLKSDRKIYVLFDSDPTTNFAPVTGGINDGGSYTFFDDTTDPNNPKIDLNWDAMSASVPLTTV